MKQQTKYLIGGGIAVVGLTLIVVALAKRKTNNNALPGSADGSVNPGTDSFPQVATDDLFASNYFGRKGYLGKTYPRGIRNNNPGNIRLTKEKWQGKIPNEKNTDGAFEQFTTFEYGVRAAIKNATTHVKNGHNTIAKLIGKWAPPSENNTNAYIAYVEKSTGIKRDYGLMFNNKETVRAVMKAICSYENTASFPLTDAQFDKAWSMI